MNAFRREGLAGSSSRRSVLRMGRVAEFGRTSERLCYWLAFVVTFACTTVAVAREDSAAATLEIATFRVDVSPPLGRRVDVGFIKEFTGIQHPLLAKGLVLSDSRGVYVVCAIDYGGLCNDSYDMFRREIAEAANTSTSRVAIQSLHQHTAPVLDANTDRMLYADRPKELKSGLDAAETAAQRIAATVRNQLSELQPVTHVAAGKAKVDRVASNRRIPQSDGSIVARYSSTGDDQMLRNTPEGVIDPWLRTVTFYAGNKPLARLHYYASHPQTSAGGRVSYDVVGYGECAPWYIGEDRIYIDRGGYEQSWSFVGPCEQLMHATIARLLGGDSNRQSKLETP